MARRNLWRSLLTASVLTLSGLAGVLAVAPPPAGAAGGGASLFEIHLSENGGFSPGVVDVKVGDYLAFVLDTQYSASDNHSVTRGSRAAGSTPSSPSTRATCSSFIEG